MTNLKQLTILDLISPVSLIFSLSGSSARTKSLFINAVLDTKIYVPVNTNIHTGYFLI